MVDTQFHSGHSDNDDKVWQVHEEIYKWNEKMSEANSQNSLFLTHIENISSSSNNKIWLTKSTKIGIFAFLLVLIGFSCFIVFSVSHSRSTHHELLDAKSLDLHKPHMSERLPITTSQSSRHITLDEAYEEGYNEGYEQGEEDGELGYYHGFGYDDTTDYNDSYEEQYQEGYEIGYDEGYATGYSECKEMMYDVDYDDDDYDYDVW